MAQIASIYPEDLATRQSLSYFRHRTFWANVISLSFLLAIDSLGVVSAQDLAPAIPGTNWQLLSLTGKGEAIKDAQNPADVEFLKDGKWGILHYGGRREAGKYEVKGDRLIMKTEDGALYQDAKMSWKASDKILELNSGDYLMRLRLFKPK